MKIVTFLMLLLLSLQASQQSEEQEGKQLEALLNEARFQTKAGAMQATSMQLSPTVAQVPGSVSTVSKTVYFRVFTGADYETSSVLVADFKVATVKKSIAAACMSKLFSMLFAVRPEESKLFLSQFAIYPEAMQPQLHDHENVPQTDTQHPLCVNISGIPVMFETPAGEPLSAMIDQYKVDVCNRERDKRFRDFYREVFLPGESHLNMLFGIHPQDGTDKTKFQAKNFKVDYLVPKIKGTVFNDAIVDFVAFLLGKNPNEITLSVKHGGLLTKGLRFAECLTADKPTVLVSFKPAMQNSKATQSAATSAASS
jgi:hypothetical protein